MYDSFSGPAGDTNNPPERRKKSAACGIFVERFLNFVEGGDLSDDEYMICFMSCL